MARAQFVLAVLAISGVLGPPAPAAATVGAVVPISGQSADIALDQARGLLYIANYARVVWADLGYAILIGILLPLAIFRALV